MMMKQSGHSDHEVDAHNTLVTLPIEILVYICSFLSVRDIVKIRCVSKILRRVSETPTLWKTFTWSLNPPCNSEFLEYVLKLFGEHIKKFHFADVTPSRLEVLLKFCKNVTDLHLPSFTYYNEVGKLKNTLCSMASLQILHIQTSTRAETGVDYMQQLFKLASNLKELSIYPRRLLDNEMTEWIEYWANSNYVPRKLNIILNSDMRWYAPTCYCYFPVAKNGRELRKLVDLTILENKKLSKVLDLPDIAWFNLYHERYTDFVSDVCYMYIQVKITDTLVTFPSEQSRQKIEFPEVDGGILHLNLTQGTNHCMIASEEHFGNGGSDEYIDSSFTYTSLISVTYLEFLHIWSTVLLSEHLEWLSFACPNLQKLDLSGHASCLRDFKGFHNLAKNCRSLRCLSLKGMHAVDVETQTLGSQSRDLSELWEILLCTMHLSELYVEGWMLLRLVPYLNLRNKFQNYSSLHVLDVNGRHPYNDYIKTACTIDSNSLLLLSYFPSITYCKLNGVLICDADVHRLKQLFNYKYLRSLSLQFSLTGKYIRPLSLEGHCTCLQELYIDAKTTVLVETFINVLCSHGGLEYVVLHVKALTARSITNLIKHSPNLVTFEVTLCPKSWMELQLKHLIAHVRTRFFRTKLIDGGFFSVKLRDTSCEESFRRYCYMPDEYIFD